MFRPLLKAFKSDMLSIGIEWKGDSETLKKYLQDYRIDPKFDKRYSRFYVNRRHTAAVSYTWRGTNLFEIADKAELSENLNELVWNDVLVVNQFSISSSDQVICTTDIIYCNCKVWVFLDNDYLRRAWCLAETGQYTDPGSRCVLIVYGKTEFNSGTDFLGGMDAGVQKDLPLIARYILNKFVSRETFNHAIDRAIVRLSPLSLIYQGRYEEARSACEQEIEMLKAAESTNTALMAKAYETMGTVLYRLGQYDCAWEFLTSALQSCGESELELRGDITNRMGTVFTNQGKYTDALEKLSESLDIRTRCFGTGHVSVANTEVCIANVRSQQGDYENALLRYNSALEIYLKSLGPSHVIVAKTYKNMGCVEDELGNFQKALDLYQKALDIEIKSLGGAHVSVAATYKNMGCVEDELGNFQKALDLYQKALDIEIKSLGGAHVSVADTKYNIACLYRKQGNKVQARELFRQAGSVYSKVYGELHKKTVDAFAQAAK